MRFCKKAITYLLVMLLACAMLQPAFAANSVQAGAGESVTVTFTFNNVFNVDGAFVITDPQGIVSGYTVSVADAGATSATVSGNRLWAAPAAEPVGTTVKAAVKVSIKAGAAQGASCTISFTGIYGDASEAPGNEHDIYQSATVTVGSGGQGGGSGTSNPGNQMDYTYLDKQIAAARNLSSVGYTSTSWNAVSSALAAARSARSSGDQSKVDAAARTLEEAIAALTPMDYSLLEQALAAVNSFNQKEELGDLWQDLTDAVNQGSAMLTGGDQAAVDAAAYLILDLLEQVETELAERGDGQVVEIPVEVPVDVLPEEDYCNIPGHRVWPIVFFVSLALNVALAAVIVLYVMKKARNRKDDTPLVDYDIGDDEY